ncbi:MAG TPA: RNA polymerase sigma factor [Polyangiaceae bacterium]
MTSKSANVRHLRLLESEPALEVSPRPALDDSQLLAALRAADIDVAGALHDRLWPVIHRTVARLLGRSDADVEDLCQLAFIEVIDGIESFRGDCTLEAWVSVIAARVVYKHIRRRRLERRLFEPSYSEAPARSTRSPVAFRDTLRRVRHHLAKLDANRSWTFLLHDVCGYDLREVAQITGVSVAAAQSRLVRGRRDLHERIGRDPELCSVVQQLVSEEWVP